MPEVGNTVVLKKKIMFFCVMPALRGEEGLDFMKVSVFANKIIMNCLHIHLVTLFNLLCIHIFV